MNYRIVVHIINTPREYNKMLFMPFVEKTVLFVYVVAKSKCDLFFVFNSVRCSSMNTLTPRATNWSNKLMFSAAWTQKQTWISVWFLVLISCENPGTEAQIMLRKCRFDVTWVTSALKCIHQTALKPTKTHVISMLKTDPFTAKLKE